MLFQEIKWKKNSQLSFGNKGDSSSCIPCKPPYCFYCLCPQNIMHIIKKWISTIKARRVSIDMSMKRRTKFEISFDLPFLLQSDPVIRYLTYKCYPYPPVKSAYFSNTAHPFVPLGEALQPNPLERVKVEPRESLMASHSFLSGIPSDCCWLQACNLCQICKAVSTL